MKNPLHPWELAALWTLAIGVIYGSIYVATLASKQTQSETYGIVIGGLMAALPMLINAMRNIGQAQAMQSMAEHLGNSTPVDTTSVPKDVGAAGEQVADAAKKEADAILELSEQDKAP